jgi:hypothetical protein
MNPLGVNLENKIVVLKEGDGLSGPEEQRKFLCQKGFGLMPFTHGVTITGVLMHLNESRTISSEVIEKAWVEPMAEVHAEPAADPKAEAHAKKKPEGSEKHLSESALREENSPEGPPESALVEEADPKSGRASKGDEGHAGKDRPKRK